MNLSYHPAGSVYGVPTRPPHPFGPAEGVKGGWVGEKELPPDLEPKWHQDQESPLHVSNPNVPTQPTIHFGGIRNMRGTHRVE